MIETKEVLYRYQKKNSIKSIARSLGMSRNTTRSMIRLGQSLGLKAENQSPEILEEISSQVHQRRTEKTHKPGKIEILLQSYHAQLESWWESPHMTVPQLVRLLQENYNITVGERSMSRYVKRHFKTKPNYGTVHLEVLPGKQAQVDFGYADLMMDPLTQRLRKAYAFIMTLSYSRYRFVRFVFKQDVETWVDCHMRAFHFFGGVPETVMLDNLKSGIAKPDFYDPTLNPIYGELERHYGFVCDPTKVRTPRHKGRVERSVTIVRQHLIAGRTYQDIEEANRQALKWCRHEISHKVTRTTGQTPWNLFTEQEKSRLLPLPPTDYECPIWRKAKVHQDHHVVFEGSFYSVPTAYLGLEVWIRATQRVVEIFYEGKFIKQHPRSSEKGKWVTTPQDYPKSARLFLEMDSKACLKAAQEIGPSVYLLLNQLLQTSSKTHLRKAQAILRLSKAFEAARLNLACRRCLDFETTDYRSIQEVLKKGLDLPAIGEKRAYPSETTAYLRSAQEFAA